jgi:T5SS/PEP-CTERM-associated repeat protein
MKKFVFFVILASACILHANSNWNVSYGDWSNSANWTELAVPTVTDDAYIDNSSTSVVSIAGNECHSLYPGYSNNSTGTLQITSGQLDIASWVRAGFSDTSKAVINMSGGKLIVTNSTLYVGFYGDAEFNQSGGTNHVYTFSVSFGSNSDGIYNLTDGTLLIETGGGYMGWNGKGTFLQSGGIMIANNFFIIGFSANDEVSYYQQTNGYSFAKAMKIGYNSGSAGRMDLFNTAKHVSANYTYVGLFGSGELNIYDSADFCVYNYNLYIGGNSGSTGVVNLVSGSLSLSNTVNRTLFVGNEGSGTLNLGNAETTGVVTNQRYATGGSLIVKATASADGTVNGWGDVGLYSTLENNGRIIANGYGIDRALNMSNFASFNNKLDNTTDNGWFAINQGELILADVAVSGAGLYNWGELSTDTSIDLVNSVKLDLADGTGNLTGKLLASDRTDVPEGLDKIIGVWTFSGVTPSSAILSFRYDDVLAAENGLSTEKLAIYQFVDGSWVRVAGSVDDVNKIITTDSVSTLSTFAVAKAPARGSCFIIK